ncbi:MAG: hypothetical protein E7013_04170 [Alphaproteobacteria bacterium]|nr:hypothetical protein [Alphaproteobacteria bacterium]
MQKKKNLKKVISSIALSGLVVLGSLFANHIHNKNKQEAATQAKRQALISQIYNTHKLHLESDTVYLEELKAFQILLNQELPEGQKVKEDGFNAWEKKSQYEYALEALPEDSLKRLLHQLMPKIDRTVLQLWMKGDISRQSASTFDKMLERRAEAFNKDGTATKEVQLALRQIGFDVLVDGKYGKQTQAALANVFKSTKNIQMFAQAYNAERNKTDNAKILMQKNANQR